MRKRRSNMVCLESIALMVFLLFTGTKCGFAQATKDFQLRQELGIAWKPLKRTEVNVGYRLNLHDNASRFRRSMFSVGGNYELFKWWRIGAEYRYYTSYDQDRNRFQTFTRWNYKMGRLNLSYRLQYQQTQDYFDEEYLQYNPPARVLRNRVQVRYLLTKKIELYSFAESFTQRSEGEYLFYRMRYAAGMEYLYKRRHSFNLELFANDEFNLKRPEDRLTLVLGYTFHIDKKKKRGSADKAEPAPEAVPKGN